MRISGYVVRQEDEVPGGCQHPTPDEDLNHPGPVT